MPSRYDYSQYAVDPKRFRPEQASQGQKNEQGFLKFLGALAPVAGTAIGAGVGALGGPGGMAAGAGLGNMLGQGAGGLLSYGGDQVTAGMDQRNADKASRKAALMNLFASLR